MERIVIERLRWHLETEDFLMREQAGFRQFHSTEDQATYLFQEIEDGFKEQKLVLVFWVDLQKALDGKWLHKQTTLTCLHRNAKEQIVCKFRLFS